MEAIRHVLGFVWDVYVPSVDDLHAIREYVWTKTTSEDFPFYVGLVVTVLVLWAWMHDQRHNYRQAQTLRKRHKEFLRLQDSAVKAGYLPKEAAIRPSDLHIPTTAVGDRADHRARLAMLMEATKAIKTLESSHKMEKSSKKMQWGKKKPPAGQPPREPPSQKGLQRILASMKRKVA